MNSHPASSRFAPTRWTLVERARGAGPEGQRALSELCEAYWNPVFHFLRCAGRSDDLARELTQEFFARLLNRGLEGVDQGRGKFRSFLLGAVKHFLSDVREHERCLKRGGGAKPEPLLDSDETCPALQVPDPKALPGDAFFDRQWAFTVMGRALEAVGLEYEAAGKGEFYRTLKVWLVGDAPTLSQADAARQLEMSEGAIKVAIHRLRKRFREVIRAEIAQTLGDADESDEELRYLVEVLSREGGA